jgi:hypothetical protein
VIASIIRLRLIIPVLMLMTAIPGHAQDISFDNLERVENSEMAVAYIDPEADFTVFRRVFILEPEVAFRANWQRDQQRNRTSRVRASDMERIRADVGVLLKEVFVEALEANDGFEVVDEVADDVLLVRPAIIDLDVTAPDTNSAGRSRQFSSTAGAATLYVELFDSVSGKIIGRAADRRVARRAGGQMMWSNSVTNRAEARRMFRVWANRLREFMDTHYAGK